MALFGLREQNQEFESVSLMSGKQDSFQQKFSCSYQKTIVAKLRKKKQDGTVIVMLRPCPLRQ